LWRTRNTDPPGNGFQIKPGTKQIDNLKLILNAHVVMCDPGNRGGRYNLLIRNDRIEEIAGSGSSFDELRRLATTIDASNKIIIPGFVNAHCHSESLLLAERTSVLPFEKWGEDGVLQEAQRRMIGSDDVLGMTYRSAYDDHLRHGTTCVGESLPRFGYRETCAFLAAVRGSGIRMCATIASLSDAEQIAKERTEGVEFMIGLGDEEDYTVYSFESRSSLAEALGMRLAIHLGERRNALDDVRKHFRMRPVEVLRRYGLLGPGRLLQHLNHVDKEEVSLIADTKTPVVICPLSAAHKGTGFPSLPHLIQGGTTLALGTDWGDTDLFGTAKFLSHAVQIMQDDSSLTATDVLRMATRDGAEVLGMETETGSIEPGKKADILFLDMPLLPGLPGNAHGEMIAQYVLRNLDSRNISAVMIDGRFAMNRNTTSYVVEDPGEVIHSIREKFFGDGKGGQTAVLPGGSVSSVVSRGKPGPGAVNRKGSLSRPSQDSRDSRPPEWRPTLPGNVKRVFGEEDT
jgi:5-methylthioadenosine/S-adenosylhomocysteine deaminase